MQDIEITEELEQFLEIYMDGYLSGWRTVPSAHLSKFQVDPDPTPENPNRGEIFAMYMDESLDAEEHLRSFAIHIPKEKFVDSAGHQFF